MRNLALCAALALFAGCPPKDGAAGGTAEEAKNALPDSEYVKVNVPAHAGKVGPATGQLATFYLVTLGTAVSLNGGAATILILVKTITEFPVTSVAGDTYIWGPWHETLKPSEYRLRVRQNEDGDYEWTLEGRKIADGASAPFLAVVSGVATPGRPHRGSGSFTFDLTVAKQLDPLAKGDGQVSVQYNLETNPITVVMDAESPQPAAGGGTALATFHYAYSERPDQSGELDFMVYGDTDDPGPAWEMSEIHSRWNQTAAGRADVKITGGDLGSLTVTASECCDSSFERTYYNDSVLWTPTEGSAASCAF